MDSEELSKCLLIRLGRVCLQRDKLLAAAEEAIVAAAKLREAYTEVLKDMKDA